MNLEQVKAVFAQAAALASPGQRAAYLDCACAGDPALRERVESLLAAQEQIGDFLESPLLGADTPDRAALVGARIGPYRLLEQIGEGGFGIVYMAEQEKPVRRKVALKLIKAGMDTKQVIARFEAERQALAMMDHPNIAKVLDAGTVDFPESQISNFKSEIQKGRPYFVMELVNGIPVTEFCEQTNLSIPQRIDLFIQVCHAVQHAHQKGIIGGIERPGRGHAQRRLFAGLPAL